MKSEMTIAVMLCLLLVPFAASFAGSGAGGSAEDVLKSVIGAWEGTCRTWFKPGQLADESPITGEFTALQGGSFVRYTYQSTMKGKPYSGEHTLSHDKVEDHYQSAWFDSFHMNYAQMFSEGPGTATGFSVKGQYRMSRDQKHWGWRTEFEMKDPDHLTITAYNITPDGQEGKAVEAVLIRKN